MAWNKQNAKKTPKKSKYSQQQKNAYNSGMGFSVAWHGKKIKFDSNDMQNSFMAGFKAGTQKIARSPKKYPDNPRAKRK